MMVFADVFFRRPISAMCSSTIAISPRYLGVFVPSKTPKDIQDQLYREATKALQVKAVQDKLTALGGEPFDMTSAEFDGFFRAQIKQNRELVKAAGIKPH